MLRPAAGHLLLHHHHQLLTLQPKAVVVVGGGGRLRGQRQQQVVLLHRHHVLLLQQSSQASSSSSSSSSSDKKDNNTNVLKALEDKDSTPSLDLDAVRKWGAEQVQSASRRLQEARDRLMSSSTSPASTTTSAGETASPPPPKPGGGGGGGEEEWYSKKVSFWMRRYENFVGLTEVKAAQERVVQAERAFVAAQEQRREAQLMIREVQERVKELHGELEKTYRGEDKYLTLITQEHAVLKDEQRLMAEFKDHEKRERESFALLSAAVRDSHEKERAQAEKTKYWSVIGSVVGTCLGILGTTVNNRMRMRELRELVSRSASGERLLDVADELGAKLGMHEDRLRTLAEEVSKAAKDSRAGAERVGQLGAAAAELKVAADRVGAGRGNAEDKASALVAKKADEATKTLSAHARALQSALADLRKEVQSQSRVAESAAAEGRRQTEALARLGDERDRMIRESFGSLYNNQTSISTAFQERTRQTEDRVKEVHALIKSIQASAVSRRDRELRALQNLDSTLVDKIEDALEDHEARMRTTAVLSGIFVACLTPVAVFAFNKLL